MTLGIRRQVMDMPYRRSRGGTNINKIRTIIRSNYNSNTSIWDSFRSKKPVYNNLIYVERTGTTGIKQHTEKMNIMLMNIQSIKSKELQLHKVIHEENIDLCVLTETWLSNNIEDDTWVKCSVLNNNNLKLANVNRISRKGGGVALVYNNNLKVKHLEGANKMSFEYAIWGLEHKGSRITIVAIYRPPYSTTNQATVQSFFEEFTNWIETKSNEYNNIVVLGDFNIHINNDLDAEANRFKDIMEALGLQQHVSFATHRYGNTLDHIYTEIGSTVVIDYCKEGPILSDHTAIICGTNIQKGNITRQEVSYRKINGIDIEELSKDIKFDPDYYNNKTVDELVSVVERTLKEALDKHAPEVRRTVTIRQKTPWFNQQVLDQKRLVRQRERTWKKYKQQHHWEALTNEKKRYRSVLKKARCEAISTKVAECKSDIKSLYNLVNNITGGVKQNPLPKCKNDKCLADTFADYFIDKIQKIREVLDSQTLYDPIDQEAPTIEEFSPFTEEDIEEIIASI